MSVTPHPPGFCCGSILDPFSTGREEQTGDAQGTRFSPFFPEVRYTALGSWLGVFTVEVGGGLTSMVRTNRPFSELILTRVFGMKYNTILGQH